MESVTLGKQGLKNSTSQPAHSRRPHLDVLAGFSVFCLALFNIRITCMAVFFIYSIFVNFDSKPEGFTILLCFGMKGKATCDSDCRGVIGTVVVQFSYFW